MSDVVYKTTVTTSDFHKADNFVRAIMGPIGSGKSVACCWEIMIKAAAQEPNEDGIRKSRWVIIRNTYRELVDTTMQTWFDWFPISIGLYRAQDMKFTVHRALEDGTTMHLEILFRALDKPNDIKKLLSLELTGGWINEAREIPKPVLDMLMGRVGRFPNMRDGGATWFGVIMDTNPPDEDHWWYRVFEEERPPQWHISKQPSGLSTLAENIPNLPKGYYANMMTGKDPEWIKVYVHGKYGFVSDGKPVYPEYNDEVHYDDTVEFVPELPVYIGVDFGLTPAAAFFQQHSDGQYQIIDELVTQDMAADLFAIECRRLMNRKRYGFEEGWGDPSGDQRVQTDANTPFLVMDANKVPLTPAPTNDPAVRRDAVAQNLTGLTMSGRPRLALGPNCKILRKAFNGGFKYKRMQVSNSEIYADKPDKNMYSHVSEALQYGLLGMGEGDNLMFGNVNRNEKVRVIPGLNRR